MWVRNAGFLPARIAGLPTGRNAALTDGRAAGVTLEVSGVARMALFTADRWLIKDFFCTVMTSSVESEF
jgi:hypothetical protein